MENRYKIIVGAFVIFIVLGSGRSFLAKKAGKKPQAVATPEEVVNTPVVPEKKVETVAVTQGKTDASTQVTESVEEKVESKPASTEPVKLTFVELENIAGSGLCTSDWEKAFCTKMSSSIPAFKGATMKDDRLFVIVDSGPYFFRAQNFSVANAEPVDPAANQGSSMGAPPVSGQTGETEEEKLRREKKNEIASALLMRDLMTTVKEEIRMKEMTLVFLKDQMSPISPSTFALHCSGSSLANLSSDVFSDEKLKKVDFDYSPFCKNN